MVTFLIKANHPTILTVKWKIRKNKIINMNRFYLVLYFGIISTILFGCEGDEYKQANQFFEQGQYEKAIDQYDQFLEYKPDHVESIYNKGRAFEELGEFEKSLASYEKTLEIEPKNVNALMSLGKHYFRNENYQDAAFYFSKASKVQKNNAQAHFYSARSLHKSGNTDKAMDAYNDAISMNKDMGEAYLYRGALKVYLGKKSAGCNDFKLASSLGVEEAANAQNQYCK